MTESAKKQLLNHKVICSFIENNFGIKNIFKIKVKPGLFGKAYYFKTLIDNIEVGFVIDHDAIAPNRQAIRFYDSESKQFISRDEESCDIGYYDFENYIPTEYDKDKIELLKKEAYLKAKT